MHHNDRTVLGTNEAHDSGFIKTLSFKALDNPLSKEEEVLL